MRHESSLVAAVARLVVAVPHVADLAMPQADEVPHGDARDLLAIADDLVGDVASGVAAHGHDVSAVRVAQALEDGRGALADDNEPVAAPHAGADDPRELALGDARAHGPVSREGREVPDVQDEQALRVRLGLYDAQDLAEERVGLARARTRHDDVDAAGRGGRGRGAHLEVARGLVGQVVHLARDLPDAVAQALRRAVMRRVVEHARHRRRRHARALRYVSD